MREASGREQSSNPSAEDGRNHVEEQRETQDAADATAAVNADFSAHLGTDKLLVHRAWVQREEQAADRRGQERIRVWLLTSSANLVDLSVGLGKDINLDTKETVYFHHAVLVLGFHRQPERLVVLPLEIESTLLHVHLVVVLVDSQWTLSQAHVFESLLAIEA